MPGRLAAEPLHQHVAPAAERGHHPGDLGVHLLVGEGGRGGPLGRLVGAGGGVGLERRHRLGQMGRRQRRADAPAGHRVRLARAVDDHRALEQLVRQVQQRGRRAGPVVDAAIDLVRDDPDVVRLGPLGDRRSSARVYTAPVGLHGEQRMRPRVSLLLARSRSRALTLRPHSRSPGTSTGSARREMHDLRIGDPGRRGNQHPILGPEQREAGVEDRLLRSRAHDDLVGIDRPPTRHPAHVLRDRLRAARRCRHWADSGSGPSGSPECRPARAGAGVSKSGSPTPRSSTSSPAALRRLASLLMATVSEALRCWTLSESGSGMHEIRR